MEDDLDEATAEDEAEAISIHVPRVEDDFCCVACAYPFFISIHVPRVEDDVGQKVKAGDVVDFNPRPPCGGRLLKQILWNC